MQLKVEVGGFGQEEIDIEQTIVDFDDSEKIGLRVGRAVRNFLRNVPIRRASSRMTIYVTAGWVEREPRAAANGAPKRKRKKAASNGAAE
jgi:hypothetical protein